VLRQVGKRLIQLPLVLLVVTFFAFSLINLLPGDPVTTIVPFGTDEQRALLREDLGLDRPIVTRYVDWLGNLATGDLGQYYNSRRPVSDVLTATLPVSLNLMVYSQLLALLVAIPLGILTAYKAGTGFDKGANATAFGLLAIPNFVLGLLLIFFLSVKGRWFPNAGYTALNVDPVLHVKSMFLPALTLAVGQIAIYMRLLRSDMIATLQEDFITMAKAKGLPPRKVLLRHALRPSSLTLLTVAGLNVGQLIGGAVVIEALFQLPGVGLSIVQAIGAREYVAVQSFVALIGVAYVVVNFAVDMLYAVLDPRIRHASPA
jgi:peptide/nickel transport system permease protein